MSDADFNLKLRSLQWAMDRAALARDKMFARPSDKSHRAFLCAKKRLSYARRKMDGLIGNSDNPKS